MIGKRVGLLVYVHSNIRLQKEILGELILIVISPRSSG